MVLGEWKACELKVVGTIYLDGGDDDDEDDDDI